MVEEHITQIKKSVNQVKSLYTKYMDLYDKNEAAVRAQLIDPILVSLGWDVMDPAQVIPETKQGDGRADYILLVNNKPLAVIEAKNSKVDITSDKVLSQLARYCFNSGIPYGILSNGISWELFNTFQTNLPVNERVVWCVNIVEDHIETVLQDLSLLHKTTFPIVDKLLILRDIISKAWDSMWGDVDTIIPLLLEHLSKYFKEELDNISSDFLRQILAKKSLENIDTDLERFIYERLLELYTVFDIQKYHNGKSGQLVDFPITEPENVQDIRWVDPANIYLSNSASRNFRVPDATQELTGDRMFIISHPTFKDIIGHSAAEVLRKFVTRLVDMTYFEDVRLPIKRPHGSRRYIIGVEPIHPSGKPFFNPYRLQNGWYLEQNFATKDLGKIVQTIAKAVGLDTKDLKILMTHEKEELE
jgi:hypothetical protein